MEARIRHLESLLSHTDRLEAIEKRAKEWKDAQGLWQEVDPRTALSHQQQSLVAPLVYRRQEVLACQVQLKTDMERLAEIAQLLGVSTTNATISQDDILLAPILQQPPESIDPAQLRDLTQRVASVAHRIDALVHDHCRVLRLASERLVRVQQQQR